MTRIRLGFEIRLNMARNEIKILSLPSTLVKSEAADISAYFPFLLSLL